VSGLRPLVGHERVRSAVAQAAIRGDLAPALLFIGQPGVGKQRTALWLAQMLLCDAPGSGEPCGHCAHCRLAIRLEHPDIHWFFPLPRPRVSGGPDRLADALEEARSAELELRRSGDWPTVPHDEPVGIYLAHAQVIRRITNARPAMAARKAIIIGDAEQLVPQEASPEAANALLKPLEEPPGGTTIIATASDADSLLPTVRSRLLPVRFAPLPDDLVVDWLMRLPNPPEPAVARLAARLAQGSIGRAAAYLPSEDGGAGPLNAFRQRARRILDAALADGGRAYELALSQPPTRARGDFATTLDFMTGWLRDLAAVQAGAPETVVNIDAIEWLENHASRFPNGAAVAAAIADMQATLQLTELNVNPQLALMDVIRRVSSHLRSPSITRT
jgi:DNA polymerase-3 subunit delta'